MIRQVKDKYDLRLRLVQSVRQLGIKPTARLYGTSPQTVRKWLRRFEAGKRAALADRSHAPHSCPHQTPAAVEAQIIEARER
ncbi:MAG TPA: helix-turn-helix domain-containing protein, partial [Armatimonadota bacterium]|nr:helix-turn-helix domain-containing protein [Armatimonadota bacterium]